MGTEKDNGEKSVEVTPLQLLGIILKGTLKERITEEEVETICSVYYETVNEWWGEEREGDNDGKEDDQLPESSS